MSTASDLIAIANGRALFRRARKSLITLTLELEECSRALEGARYGKGDLPSNELAEVQSGAAMVADELRQVLDILRPLDTIDGPLFEVEPTEKVQLSEREREQLGRAKRKP